MRNQIVARRTRLIQFSMPREPTLSNDKPHVVSYTSLTVSRLLGRNRKCGPTDHSPALPDGMTQEDGDPMLEGVPFFSRSSVPTAHQRPIPFRDCSKKGARNAQALIYASSSAGTYRAEGPGCGDL